MSVPLAVPGYRVEGVLGRGGMGIVHRAYQTRLERWVALKVISPEAAQDPSFRERFKRESRLAAAIEHPNVLPIYDSGEADGVLYIAMRLIEGSDLREAIARDGRLDPARATRILGGVADALDAAHAKGLVHRDVKPGNILLARPGQPGEHAYLSDFGLTKNVSAESVAPGSASGALIGTADYMSPEQCRGERVDGRADVYALGCVLFQALTGRVPFPRDSFIATVWAQISDPPPAPTAARDELPPALDAVVARAMAKHPDERYPSAGDLGRAARAAVAGLAIPGAERTVARGEAAPGGPATFVPGPPPTGPTEPLAPGPPPTGRAGPPAPGRPPAFPAGPGAPGPTRVPASSVPPGAAPSRRRGPMIAVVAAVLLAAGGAAAAIALTRDGGDEGGSAGPAKPVEPVEPVKPEEPVERSEPVEPVEPPPQDTVADDREEIASLLRTYERAYDDEDVAALGDTMISSVRREGAGTSDCLQFGRDQVLDAYRSQFAAGDVPYSLDFEPSAIEVDGDRAGTAATYSTGSASDEIDFTFQRTGEGWRIATIDAVQRTCPG